MTLGVDHYLLGGYEQLMLVITFYYFIHHCAENMFFAHIIFPIVLVKHFKPHAFQSFVQNCPFLPPPQCNAKVLPPKVIGSLYCHPTWKIIHIVELCVGLTVRKLT